MNDSPTLDPLEKDNQDLYMLKRSFDHFSEKTKELKSSYLKLEDRYTDLERELIENINQLKTTSYYLKEVLRQVSQGIIMVNEQGVIELFNDSAAQFLKTSPDQVLDHFFWNHFKDRQLGFSMKIALEHQNAPSSTIIKDADHNTYEVTPTYLPYDQSGKPAFQLFVLMRNITNYQNLKMLAERNNRLSELGAMAAKLAHEIRNPLGGIKGFAELLIRDLEGSPKSAQMAQHISDGADHLDKLVNSVLVYSKPLELYLEQVDLCDEVQDFCTWVAQDSYFKECPVVVLKPDKPLFALVDRFQLRSCLFNLARNACHAMDQKGQVSIELSLEGKNIAIRIKDRGFGIDEKLKEKIFSPFFTTKHTGYGVGLSEVHKIIQAHDGQIDLESSSDKGSVFCILVPAHKQRL